ncbi:MAG: response regulator [Lachnospiraceae bacterium]|nr:response regulator [Lachnospiraceae bacterium]
MEKKTYTVENGRRRERSILIVYVVYTIAITLVSVSMDWATWIPQLINTGMVASVVMYLKEYKSYQFRALFTTAMIWLNFVVYGMNVEDLLGFLPLMCAITVFLGLYSIPETVYLAVVASLFLVVYHGLFLSRIHISSLNEGTIMVMRFICVFLTEYVTYFLIKKQAESSRRLMETIESLKKAEKSKDDFMANVSHEIRTPINTVCGMTEMILREDISDVVRKDVFDIQTAGRNLLTVVSDILDFSELESGKMEIIEEPYNITSTINDIMNMTSARKNNKNIEIIVNCDANIPSGLVGDEQKIRRAVMNIVDNAVKFTNEGGVVINVSARKEEYGVNLCIGVKDTGIGMTEETMEKLFTSFNQVDTKRNRQEGGIGLGLAIAQAIVSGMGGFITVKSTLGKGSEFQIVIPQKVFEETPIVSLKHADKIYVCGYIDMEKYDSVTVRDGYQNCIQNIVKQLGIKYRHCRNLAELKRRVEKEKFTHIFIAWEEYCEDQQYFEELSYQMKVILVHERATEDSAAGQMLYIYKPFSVLAVASVLNGENIIQSLAASSYQNRRFIAPRASVLVVDDNVMNLRVVEGLLRPYKIKVFVAGSGKEALKKIESMDFDCVFMDHMMPEMDGVETLHRIRQKPGQYFKNVPIIALTANAIGGAREMFLSEGFDDFVAKPIEISVLERVMRKHIPENKIIKVEEAEAERVEQLKKSLQNTSDEKENGEFYIKGIDIETGLTYAGGNIKDYIDIVQIYYTSGLTKKEQIQKAFEEKDWKNYAILTHSLKSTSMSIGAVVLSDMAKGLEMAGKSEDEPYIYLNHEVTMAEYGRVLEEIRKNEIIFPKDAQDDTDNCVAGETAEADVQENNLPEIPEEKLYEALERLEEQLGTFEYEGVQSVLEELLEYQYHGMRLDELFESVKEKAEAFDFMGAEEELEATKEKMR